MQALCFSCMRGDPFTDECDDNSEFVEYVDCFHHGCRVNIRVKCPYYVPDPEKI